MGHVSGLSRDQLVMFPQCIDDYVGEENPVRVIDAFVESLDMIGLGFAKSVVANVGRKPYDPKAMLKLYFWGYVNKINSSRRLERETKRNLEVKWLLRELEPDDKTISEFRRLNKKAIKGVFIQFRLVCQGLGLFGGKEVAIDSSKFKASNSKKRNKSKARLTKRVTEIQAEIDEHLNQLEKNDASEMKISKVGAQELAEKISKLQERMQEYQGYLEEINVEGKTQVSQTDPDSRLMVRSGNGGAVVGYNVQTSVDGKNALIVDYEVTNEQNDSKQLSKQSQAAKEALNAEEIDVLADTGYHSGAELKACEEMEGVTTYVPGGASSATKKSNIAAEYEYRNFEFDAVNDEYVCPEGQRLVPVGKPSKRGSVLFQRYKTSACKECAARTLCTSNKEGRTISRSENQDAIDAVAQRTKAAPEKTKRRGQIAEHPFGTIKNRGQGSFLTRGIGSVSGEFGFSALAYNFTRAVNLVGVSVLIASVVGAKVLV